MPSKMERVGSIFSRRSKKSNKQVTRPPPVHSSIRCYPLRLGPGVELISTIHTLMEEISVQSLFILSCIGTLAQCSFGSRQLTKKGYEIVSLQGSFDHESHYIMGQFADPETGALIGGRVHSLTIYTTCELMLAEPLDCSFHREFDFRTGQDELAVRRKTVTEN